MSKVLGQMGGNRRNEKGRCHRCCRWQVTVVGDPEQDEFYERRQPPNLTVEGPVTHSFGYHQGHTGND